MARRAIGIEATADDKASEPLARVAEALKQAAEQVANSDARLTTASEGVVKAQAARIPAAQRVKLELEREAAAGDATRERLAELALESARLEAQLLKLARANKPIPSDLLQAANAAKTEAEALKQAEAAAVAHGQAVEQSARTAAAELEKASAQARANAKADRDALEAFGLGAVGAVGAIATATAAAGVTAAAGLFALTKEAAESGDRLFVLGDKLGVGTDQLSRLAFAARQNGASFEQLSTSLQALSNRAIKAPQEFARIGVSVRDAGGKIKSADVLFRDVAEAISRLPPGAERVAAAQALMEEGGRALVPVLQQGAAGVDALAKQSDALGVTLEQSAANQANAFGNQLAALDDVVSGLSRRVGLVFAPTFTEAFKAAQLAVGSFSGDATRDLGEMQRAVGRSAGGVVGALAAIVEAYEKTQGIFDEGGRILEGLQALDAEVGGALSDGLAKAANTVLFGLPDQVKRLGDMAEDTAAQLEKLAATKRSVQTESSKLAQDLRALQETLLAGDFEVNVTPQAGEASSALAEALDRLEESLKKKGKATRGNVAVTEELADAHVEALKAATDLSDFEEADAAAAAARTRSYEEGLREELRLAAERDRAEQEALNEKVRATAEAERARTQALEAEAQRRQQIEQAVAGQLEGTLVRAYEAAKDGPKAFADFALAELERILVSTIARQLAGFIAGLFGGILGGGAGGAVASAATSFATGGLALTSAGSAPAALPAGAPAGGLSVTFNQSIPSTRAQLRRDLRDRVLPELRALERR